MGRLEGIVIVVEALLLKKGLEVNAKNVSKVLKKLELSNYTEDILEVYFSIKEDSYPKYFLKYTDYLGGEEVATGFIENENGVAWYFDKKWAERMANQLCTEFRNVVVEKEEL